MKQKHYWYLVIMLVSLCMPIYAFQIDGDLSDWGVTPASDLNANIGIASWVEDYVGSNGYVGPAYGGQPYDVEALYVAVDNSNIYFAMVLGMPPEGSHGVPYSSNYFYPGDLAFDLNGDGEFEYGLEFTGHSDNSPNGGPANGEYTYEPEKIGNIYEVSNSQGWNQGLDISGYTETELNYRQSQYLTLIGNTSVVYVQSDAPEHYVVETSIPLALLEYEVDSNWLFHWTMTCGNDIGEVTTVYSPFIPPTPSVPEPFSFLLLGISIAGIYLRRK